MKNSDSLEIREAVDSKTLKEFIHFPYRLYEDDPNWVAPLLSEEKKFYNPRHNQFLQHNPVALFMCYRNSQPVGRIAAIINGDHNNYHNDHAAFFGSFETVNDRAVAELLLSTAETWLKAKGADVLRGPTTFSTNNISGVLVEGFDEPPFVLMSYNGPYYSDLLKKYGFKQVMRFFAYEVTEETITFPAALSRMEERLLDRDIVIRNVDYKQLEKEAEIVTHLFNQAWSDNWGFVPFTKEEVLEEFENIKIFARRDLIFIAEHKAKPIGFCFSVPDINQALISLKGRLFPFNWIKLIRKLGKVNQIRVVLMGVLKEYRNRGVDFLFYQKTVENGLKHGYRRAELSWILENNNSMNRVLEHINARRYKTYGMYEKKIK
jgi:GNAT superfamily N-acetyltransferase